MKIITLSCEECGTLVAGNVLEEYRQLKCPRTTCENVLSFADLSSDDRNHILSNLEKYRME